MRKMLGAAMLLALAACDRGGGSPGASEDGPPPPPMPVASADGPAAGTTAVALDGEGLRFIDKATGSATLLAFGAPRAQAESALARVAGAADDRNRNEECGAGAMEFTRFDAMTLNFQDGNFVGWFLGNEPGATLWSTMSGIGIGTSRHQAAESVSLVPVPDSTLGEEFTLGEGAGAIGGFFSAAGDDGVVESLFAGTNCFFR